jgi:chorismate mutase
MDVDHWRQQIDELDEQILKLLNARARCALEIGRIKKVDNIPVHDPEREKRIMKKLRDTNPGPLTHDGVQRVFERIIDESRRLEKEL